jgi:large subunit ribosomal protein L21
MYAIVKTGGKQYKVAPGDKINIEKLDVEPGDKVELEAICVDGDKVEADPAKAAKTKVVATVLEQFKGDKQLVFKFKKRKNYKKLRGHRQSLTRVKIESVGTAKAE